MALIKCKNCGKEISSNADRCIHCNSPIESKDRTIDNYIRDFESEKIIKTLSAMASLVQIIMIIIGIIAIIIGIATIEDDIGILILVAGIIDIILSFIAPVFIKWKAVVLKNIYEINMKGGK